MSFHNLTFPGALIVYATQMEQTVNDHPMQLLIIDSPEFFSIASDRIKRNEQISADTAPMRIIKRYDIGEIIVTEKFEIYLKNFWIGTKNVGYRAEQPIVFTGHRFEPPLDKLSVDLRKLNILRGPLYHFFH